MKIRRIVILAGIGVLICLAVIAVAGNARLVRPDILSALACMPRLFDGNTFDHEALARYRDTLTTEAEAFGMPPELLAAVIIGHQRYQTPLRNFTDCAGSALGYNLSLGLAQVRLSTAVENGDRYMDDVSHGEFHKIRSELLASRTNIRHAARELRALLERENRFPGITSGALLEDPYKVALLLSEYRAGWKDTPADSSRQSANAFADMQLLLGDEVFLFGMSTARVNRLQLDVREYLDHIYCDSGIFNSGVCDGWLSSPARNQEPPD